MIHGDYPLILTRLMIKELGILVSSKRKTKIARMFDSLIIWGAVNRNDIEQQVKDVGGLELHLEILIKKNLD